MTTTITVNAEDYQYPSKDEREKAEKAFLSIPIFSFEKRNEIELVLNNLYSLKSASKEANLYCWDRCLLNKGGALRNAYINTKVNFDRYESSINDLKLQAISGMQFKFYVETFYYFFFSIKDIVLQIVNLYFELELKENNVDFRRIKQKVKRKDVLEVIDKFEKNIKIAIEIRNGMTHRFPVTENDDRSEIQECNGQVILMSSFKEFEPEVLMENVKESLNHFFEFISSLKSIFSN